MCEVFDEKSDFFASATATPPAVVPRLQRIAKSCSLESKPLGEIGCERTNDLNDKGTFDMILRYIKSNSCKMLSRFLLQWVLSDAYLFGLRCGIRA